MSGPKVIDIAATRELERLRLGVLCCQIEEALKRLERILPFYREKENADMPGLIRQQIADLQKRSQTSEQVVEIMSLVESAKSQLFFVHSEKDRIEQFVREWRSVEAVNCKSLDQTIARLREAVGGDEALRRELDRASAEPEFLARAKIVAAVSSSIDERRAASAGFQQTEAIRKLAADWEKLVAAGSFETSQLPVLPQERWRIELEKIRDELADHTAIVGKIIKIEAETDLEKRQMLMDALRYEAAALLRSQRTLIQREEWIAQSRDAFITLQILDAERENALAAARGLSPGDFEEFRLATEKTINVTLESAAATYAREAILESLKTLGYEVRTGMATAWVENGKIVLSKPTDPVFGIELSALPSGNQNLVKTRVVRTCGAAANTADEKLRDREQEEIWCGDREKMETLLAEKGVELTIKTARKPGEIPVAAINPGETTQPHEQVRRKTL